MDPLTENLCQLVVAVTLFVTSPPGAPDALSLIASWTAVLEAALSQTEKVKVVAARSPVVYFWKRRSAAARVMESAVAVASGAVWLSALIELPVPEYHCQLEPSNCSDWTR